MIATVNDKSYYFIKLDRLVRDVHSQLLHIRNFLIPFKLNNIVFIVKGLSGNLNDIKLQGLMNKNTTLLKQNNFVVYNTNYNFSTRLLLLVF